MHITLLFSHYVICYNRLPSYFTNPSSVVLPFTLLLTPLSTSTSTITTNTSIITVFPALLKQKLQKEQ